jgi:transcriptional regulator with XRE-family HTH domain
MKGNILYKRLGEKITIERKRRKLSQEELAFMSNMDRTYLARIEEGKANPSVKILNKIARNLQVKIYDLLKGV